MTKTVSFASAALAAACLVAACGGSSTGPSSGGSGGGGGGGGSTNTTTITITSAGASPRDITVSAGSRVTFVNNDTQPHDMASNPHPEHTDCPALVAFATPGNSATTLNLNTVRTCGFHDHNQPSNTNLQGVIRIQ
jgi:plastocyanin